VFVHPQFGVVFGVSEKRESLETNHVCEKAIQRSKLGKLSSEFANFSSDFQLKSDFENKSRSASADLKRNSANFASYCRDDIREANTRDNFVRSDISHA
jgi:hypothetical protein